MVFIRTHFMIKYSFIIFAEHMKTKLQHTSDVLKARFIDYILSVYGQDVIIGNEVMYGTAKKVVDLILLIKGKTYAIEIKSDEDNLKRIEGQITEYRKTFDYIIIVSGDKYSKILSESLPCDIGLYLISRDSKVKRIRKPHKQHKLLKEDILCCIRSSYLKKLNYTNCSKLNSDEVRIHYSKKRISYIQEILYTYWEARFKPGFNNFLAERTNDFTLIDDLSSFCSLRVVSNV